MADSKVTALTEQTAPESDILLYAVDDPGGTPSDKKIVLGNIVSRLINKTSSATLTAAELLGPCTLYNTGAAGEVILTWVDPPVANQKVKCYVGAAQYLQIKAPAGVTIRSLDLTSINGGYVRSNVIGDYLEIVAVSATILVITNLAGTGWVLETT
jgi:hypothetical protein